jgi:hypothetical protein
LQQSRVTKNSTCKSVENDIVFTPNPHEKYVILKANAGALAVVGASRLAVGADLVALGVLAADNRREDHRLGVATDDVARGVLAANRRRLRGIISMCDKARAVTARERLR